MIGNEMIKKDLEVFLFGIIFIAAIFSATYRLSESPPTWYDEGVIIQSAKVMFAHGESGLQTEPNFIEHVSFLTTGYPVTYPIGIVMNYFGFDLTIVRGVMIWYLLGLVIVFYILARSLFGVRTAIISLLLLVSFAPLYGNGKNVLGEVPGLFFLISSFMFVTLWERSVGRMARYYSALLAGLTIGLCVATKPTFLVALPAILVAVIFMKKNNLYFREVSLFIIATLAPITLWMYTQFLPTDSFMDIMRFYVDPRSLVDMSGTILTNLSRFVSESTPVYFSILFVLWVLSIVVRSRSAGRTISGAEWGALLFVVLTIMAYLRTAGWYRYLFPAFIPMLLFAPNATHTVFDGLKDTFQFNLRRGLALTVFVPLVIFQFYQVFFNSFVASYYDSTNTVTLQKYFNALNQGTSVFFYNVPELVQFLKHDNYYEYLSITDSLDVGRAQLEKLSRGLPDVVMMNQEMWQGGAHVANLKNYQKTDEFLRYVVLMKIK